VYENRVDKEVTLTGVITAADWGLDDCITAVKLSAIDEQEYIIENGGPFITFVRKSIRATGVVDRDTGKIRISTFEILEGDFCSFDSL
jgi:hypothetical protein